MTLFIALFAMMFLASYIVINMNVDRDRIMRERADQTAWLVNEIAQAARLYVRDQNAAGVAAFQKAALCTTRRGISVNDLESGGYIRPNIGNRNPAGTQFVTPFGQTVFIIAANSRINPAACGPADLEDIAASAYIVLQQPQAAGMGLDGNTIITLASYLTSYGLPVVPPQFDAAGNNVSIPCGAGGPATIQWDTGCLTAAQYAFLAPAAPAFTANTIGLPAWLSFRGDNRAVFRFEQPENPLAQTMQTDLRMGRAPSIDPATCTQTNIRTGGAGPTDSVTVPSGICAVVDDAGGANNRFDVANVNGLNVTHTIIAPQAVDVGGADAATDLAVSGNADITGNVRSFATSNSMTTSGLTMAGGDPVLPNPVLTVAARPGGPAPTLTIAGPTGSDGLLTSSGLQAATGNVTVQTGVANGSTANATLQVNGSTLISGGSQSRGAIINRIQGNMNQMTVAGDAAIGGRTQVNVGTTAAGGGLSFATAQLRTQNAQISGTVSANNITARNNVAIPNVTMVGTCLGRCPDREEDPDAPLD